MPVTVDLSAAVVTVVVVAVGGPLQWNTQQNRRHLLVISKVAAIHGRGKR